MTHALDKSEVQQLGGDKHWAITSADVLITTVRRMSGTGGDRIICKHATYDASMLPGDNRINKLTHYHDRSYHMRFPMLPCLEMEYR